MPGVLPRHVLRRAKADQWTSANPVLKGGEPGLETDTGKFKVGNGSTPWTGLSYFADDEEFVDMVRADGPIGGPFEFLGGDVVSLDNLLASLLSSIAILEAIAWENIEWPEGPSGGGSNLDDFSVLIMYVWESPHYVLANDGTEVPENAARGFAGPVDPQEDGFTMNAGDQWFIVEVEG